MPGQVSHAESDSVGSNTDRTHRRIRPRSDSDAAAVIMRQGRLSRPPSCNYQPKLNIFTNVESTPKRFTSPLCPLNLLEEKERFLRSGIIPKFVMRSSADAVEKMTNYARGQIRFAYLAEAKAILERVKTKYGDGSTLIKEMYGPKIDEVEASSVLTDYLSDNSLDGKMAVYYSPDLSCSAKMMWHGPNLRYNKPEARKYTLIIKNSSENHYLSETGIRCLANHEIGTHYVAKFRMVNDGLQPWFSDRQRFQLRGMSARESVSSEEGLATINTLVQARARYLWSAALLYYTSCMAADMTFRELFDHLATYIFNKEQRWRHVMRVKRGLSNANDRGGYGNDQCYFEGAVEILRNIDQIDFPLLYSGRLCFDELSRVRRLARMDCIKLPRFLKDIEKYKRTLRQIAILNGLIPKTVRKPNPKKRHLKGARKCHMNNGNKSFIWNQRQTSHPVESITVIHSVGNEQNVALGKSASSSQSQTFIAQPVSPVSGITRKLNDFTYPVGQKISDSSEELDVETDAIRYTSLETTTCRSRSMTNVRPRSTPIKVTSKGHQQALSIPNMDTTGKWLGLLERRAGIVAEKNYGPLK